MTRSTSLEKVTVARENNMKKKIIVGSVAVLVVILSTFAFKSLGRDDKKNQYQFAQITRGDLENTVSSTGTINALGTVEIGTQVSGTISRIYADFNDRVSKGQLLAVLDTLVLKTTILDAEANLEKAEAQLQAAQADYDRNKALFEKGYMSDAEFLPFQINLKTQKAAVKSANASLQRAQNNLKYAFIRAPITGTVIQRNVEAGQTVAASLQSPTLFIIAEDLSQVEIHVQVDESDIGQIKQGQQVRFTVPSYSDKTFTGAVRQVRLQPEIIQNVVMYTAIVDAGNPENLLLPGMTATVDFLIDTRKDVLLVPNTVLRFQPPEEMLAEFRDRMQKGRGAMPDSARAQWANNRRQFGNGGQMPQNGGMAGQFGQAGGRFRRGPRAWYLDEKGNLAILRLKTGISDGTSTEIISAPGLKEGMQVISSIVQDSESPQSLTQTMCGPGFGRRGF